MCARSNTLRLPRVPQPLLAQHRTDVISPGQAGIREQESALHRMNNNMKRMRGRNHRGGGGGGGGGPIRHQSGNIPLNRNHVFDSQGPDLRVRGTSQQLFEKYLQLGRDATSNNDRVMAEAYFQHAEHYFRIVSAINAAQAQSQGQHQPHLNGHAHNGPRREDEDVGDPAGFGDQPTAAEVERDLQREIPIEAAPPDA